MGWKPKKSISEGVTGGDRVVTNLSFLAHRQFRGDLRFTCFTTIIPTFDIVYFSFSVCDKSNSLYVLLFHKSWPIRDPTDVQMYFDYQNNKDIQMQQKPQVQR